MNKKIIKYFVAAIVLIALFIYGFVKIKFMLSHESTDNAQIEGRMTPIISRVQGYIQQINVQDYSHVKKGDTMAVIDGRDYEIGLRQLEAKKLGSSSEVRSAESMLRDAEIAVNQSSSNLKTILIQKDKADRDYLRDENLYKDNAITLKQLEDAKTNSEVLAQQYLTAKEAKKISEAKVSEARSGIERYKAAMKSSEAEIENQRLKLSYLAIEATASGKTGKRAIEAGQFVQAGQTLFTIIDEDHFWVLANFKETQIKKMRPGQLAKISIDSYPDVEIEGTVESLSDATGAKFSLLPPDNATGNFVKITQRVPVRIKINNPEKYRDYLKAGLSLYVSVKLD